MIVFRARMPLFFSAGPADLAIELTLESGSLLGIYGPSGSGKTTLLRILAGLTTPTEGVIHHEDEIWLDMAQRINRPVQQRSVGMVFQDAALFPNMTVRENVQFATGKRRDGLVDELLELVNLQTLANRKPASLSGGQRQRVALIRALARQPQLLLLDEPFSALDEETREQLLTQLVRLHRRFGTTTLLVSHQQEELSRVADRLIRIENGRLEEPAGRANPVRKGTEQTVFTGVIDHIEGQSAQIRLSDGELQLTLSAALAPGWALGDSVSIIIKNSMGVPKEGGQITGPT